MVAAPKSSETFLVPAGIKKGAFVFSSKDRRTTWKVSGPHFCGKEIYHMAYDRRNKILFATANNEHQGASVAKSFDLGKTWKLSNPPKFPKNDREERAYVIPLEGDFFRIFSEGNFYVWTTNNSGKEWFPVHKGLPRPAYFAIYRDAMTADMEDPCGLCVGMTTGHLYASRNSGKT